MFTCKICGYETSQKYCLINHLNKKKPCTAINGDTPAFNRAELLSELGKKYNDVTFDCEWCKKKFNHKSNLHTHKKSCKSKISKPTNDMLLEKIENMQKKIDEMQNASTTNIGTVNNIQNNNVTINMRSFGYENIGHIENDLEYMTRCFINKDVMGLLENIHCDKHHPENHNVRIKSTKKALMETFVDGRWLISDQDETLDELLNKGYRIFNMFSYRNRRHLINECDEGETGYYDLRNWLEDLYNNSKVRKPFKNKLLILFMNNKTIFLEKAE